MKSKNQNSYSSSALRRHIVPILVWVLALAGVVGLFRRHTKRFEVLGIARARTVQISATMPGKLRSVPVKLFEKVKAGQVLAVLDDEVLRRQLDTASAEVQRLMAELITTEDSLVAEAANQETSRIADGRRFSVDVENARLRILELKTLIETDRITLQDLALEVKIVKGLVEAQAVADYELQKVQVQHDALAKKIQQNEHLLAQAEKDLKQAQKRKMEFASRQLVHPSVDSALELIRKAVTVQERMIEQFVVQISQLVLRSPFDGVVCQIPQRFGQASARQLIRQNGETVLAGEPILTVAATESDSVIAYMRHDQAGLVDQGSAVEIIKNSKPAQIGLAKVTYISPVTEQIRVRLWQNPNVPQWGRPFLVKVPPKMKLVPGELVGIRSQ